MMQIIRRRAHRLNKERRRQIVAEITQELSRQPEISFAILYGSFAFEPVFRDIDIAVFVEHLDRDAYSTYELHLAARIEKKLGGNFPVEIKVINGAPLPFRFQAAKGKPLVIRDDESYSDFIYDTARTYLEMAGKRRHYIKEVLS